MNDEYFNYLVNIVKGYNYTNLLRELNKIHFYPLMELDRNRISEAKDNLRSAVDFSPKTEYITILELLISLAIEYDHHVVKYDEPESLCTWFWLFISNCNLNIYDDLYFKNNKEYSINKIQEWCSMFNNRTYRRDGVGSIFPLRNPPKDMRKTELFYQLCWYINENN